MAKRIQEYVKYSVRELDEYASTEGSCVSKVNTNLHFSIGPFCLADFKHLLMAHIGRSKLGSYDVQLDGIVLDVKNVKVLGTAGRMRADDPRIHIDINADVYVFKPKEGAELTGIVKHIGAKHVGVVLYRVFNANLRVSHKVDKDEIQMDKEVKFRIMNFNLQNVFPYIDGELLTAQGESKPSKGKKTSKDSDNGDSGIEEKEGSEEIEGLQELNEFLSILKSEETDEDESPKTKKKKSSKRRNNSESDSNSDNSEESCVLLTPRKIKKEKLNSEDEDGNEKKKSSRKRKNTTPDSSEESNAILTPKKIKKEKIKIEDDAENNVTTKKVKKEKKAKKPKEQTSYESVPIKLELSDGDD